MGKRRTRRKSRGHRGGLCKKSGSKGCSRQAVSDIYTKEHGGTIKGAIKRWKDCYNVTHEKDIPYGATCCPTNDRGNLDPNKGTFDEGCFDKGDDMFGRYPDVPSYVSQWTKNGRIIPETWGGKRRRRRKSRRGGRKSRKKRRKSRRRRRR